jgi:hypothetical protein
MLKTKVNTTLVIHACPEGLRAQVESLIGIAMNWAQQDLVNNSYQSQVNLKLSWLEAEELMSSLHQVPGLYLDLTQQGQERGVLFMLCPGLGIFRADVNQAGEVLLTEDQIWSVLNLAQGNHRELQRLMRLALGQNWDDLLEPLRAARINNNVVLLHKAV